jgi:hypothetical protein
MSWENDIKVHLRETGYENERWVELAQDRVQWRDLLLVVLNLKSSTNRELSSSWLHA